MVSATRPMTDPSPAGGRSPVSRDPDVCQGLPCIRGTRIPVRAVKRFYRAGHGIAMIMDEYPGLTWRQIEAAISWGVRKANYRGADAD